ncbi:MFS transporter [Bifidobacterium biavatii DSM 23969]|uniref:MFS transporter n=2 Tax=Bifidobacterium biavatii TaxID=762212 RepID=A0A086ZHU9_9BIFI|nr:MFS transporter [Bifidobacterium biavatii DSM 23969]
MGIAGIMLADRMAETRLTLADGDTTMLTNVLELITQFATIGGGIWLVWGVVVLAGGLKDQNGPGIQSGIWQIVGGGLIIVAAQLFRSISLS